MPAAIPSDTAIIANLHDLSIPRILGLPFPFTYGEARVIPASPDMQTAKGNAQKEPSIRAVFCIAGNYNLAISHVADIFAR